MDYLNIVLKGFLGGEQKKYLDRYFGREQQEAEEKGFHADEFFDGCFGAIEEISSEIQRLYNRSKADAMQQVELAIRCENKTIEDQWRHVADQCNLYDFKLDLWNISNGRYQGSITQDDLDRIVNAISKSRATYDKNSTDACINKIVPPAKLEANFSKNGVETLFQGLFDLKCLSPDADRDTFIWVFGGRNELESYLPFKWSGTKALCAYFVEVFNYIFLKKGDENKRNKIKEFENIFQINGLRRAMEDYKKMGTRPQHYKKIDDLFKQLELSVKGEIKCKFSGK